MGTLEQQRAIWDYLEREVTRDDRAARTDNSLCHVTKSFYEQFSAQEIPGTLREWNLAERIRRSPDQPVVVTGEGVKWLHETNLSRLGHESF